MLVNVFRAHRNTYKYNLNGGQPYILYIYYCRNAERSRTPQRRISRLNTSYAGVKPVVSCAGQSSTCATQLFCCNSQPFRQSEGGEALSWSSEYQVARLVL